MEKNNVCACAPDDKLIFACSGAADVGEITDKAARKLGKAGKGKMFCTVGLGGDVPMIIKATDKAKKVLAIDGCPLDCAKHSLEKAGFNDYVHLQIRDLGMEKGKTPITDNAVQAVVDSCQKLLSS